MLKSNAGKLVLFARAFRHQYRNMAPALETPEKANDLTHFSLLDTFPQFRSHQDSSYRAPEEMHGGYIDDTADVNALGKFIYTIMTGLRVYYDEMSRKKALKVAFEGELPYIDPRYRTRSYVEGRLVEIMEQCWPYNSTERVDIFTVLSHLRETARVANFSTQNEWSR